jgi:hypothetical protein
MCSDFGDNSMKKPKPLFLWVVIVSHLVFFILPVLFYALYFGGVIQAMYGGHLNLSPSVFKIALSAITAVADLAIAVLLIRQRRISLLVMLITSVVVLAYNVSPYLNPRGLILLITPIGAPALFGPIVRFAFCAYVFRLKRRAILL